MRRRTRRVSCCRAALYAATPTAVGKHARDQRQHREAPRVDDQPRRGRSPAAAASPMTRSDEALDVGAASRAARCRRSSSSPPRWRTTSPGRAGTARRTPARRCPRARPTPRASVRRGAGWHLTIATGALPTPVGDEPATGAKANMPSTCTLITTPMISSSAPPCAMCSGVITITAIIAACAPAITTIAAMQQRALADHGEAPCPTTSARRPGRRPPGARVSRGSGRSATNSMTARGREHADGPDREGPGELGQPEASARPSAAAPVRLGPATAPIVVAQTTIESARARECCGGEVGGGVPGCRCSPPIVAPSMRGPEEQQRHRARRRPPATASTLPAAPMR